MQKIAVIGGGAAGLSFSIMAKRLLPDCEITIFEKADRVGKKLSTTGNGRCNITNESLTCERYHGDSDFAIKAINKFGVNESKEFFKSLGVIFTTLEDGKVYPMSLQAASVTDALRFALDELGVSICLNTAVTEIKRENQAFSVIAENKTYKFDVVVIATGGKSGGKLGSEDGYRFLRQMGHKTIDLNPAIVQLKTETDVVRQLKGIKVEGAVTLTSSLGARKESGEILFCDYGISGPPVLQVSRLAAGDNAKVSLDLIPSMTEDEIYSELSRRVKLFSNRASSELFAGFMNKRLGQVVLKISGGNINSALCEIDDKILRKTAKNIKNMTLKVTGTGGFENAQVTAGGAKPEQFFDNMMSKKVKGLFAIGEVLDVDGDCGGFNLAFAWASANAAANAVTDYLKELK